MHGDRLKQVQYALEAQWLFNTSPGFYSKLGRACLACLVLAFWCIVDLFITLVALLLGLFWQQVCSSPQRMVSCILCLLAFFCCIIVTCVTEYHSTTVMTVAVKLVYMHLIVPCNALHLTVLAALYIGWLCCGRCQNCHSLEPACT